MRVTFTLGAIPVLFVGVVFGILMNAPYIALLPDNVVGENNVAVLLSLFGFGFVLADRLFYLKWKTPAWVMWVRVWLWGIVLMIGGMVIWVQSFDMNYIVLFVAHWVALIGLTVLLLSKIKSKPEYEEVEEEEKSEENPEV